MKPDYALIIPRTLEKWADSEIMSDLLAGPQNPEMEHYSRFSKAAVSILKKAGFHLYCTFCKKKKKGNGDEERCKDFKRE